MDKDGEFVVLRDDEQTFFIDPADIGLVILLLNQLEARMVRKDEE